MSSSQNPKPRTSGLYELLKQGIELLPKDKRFPILLVIVILGMGAGLMVLSDSLFPLIGLAIIALLALSVLVYQNKQEARQHEPIDRQRQYLLTITVTNHGRVVDEALVTIIGPKPFTNKVTDQDGRVTYRYSGRDIDDYRNIPIRIYVNQRYAGDYVLHRVNGYLTFDITKDEADERRRSSSAMLSDTSLHLAKLLTISGRARDRASREALCNQIGVDHTLLQTTEAAAGDFALNLVALLERTAKPRLITLCDALVPYLEYYQKELTTIRDNLANELG